MTLQVRLLQAQTAEDSAHVRSHHYTLYYRLCNVNSGRMPQRGVARTWLGQPANSLGSMGFFLSRAKTPTALVCREGACSGLSCFDLACRSHTRPRSVAVCQYRRTDVQTHTTPRSSRHFTRTLPVISAPSLVIGFSPPFRPYFYACGSPARPPS